SADRPASGGRFGSGTGAVHPADRLQSGLQRQSVDAGERQCYEGGDAVPKVSEALHECGTLLNWRTRDPGRVLDAPVGGHRMTGPDRAGFAGGVVANCEYEVNFGGARLGELVPGLRPETFGRQAVISQNFDRPRVDFAPGMATRRKAAEARLAEFVRQHLADDRAGGVPGTQKEDVVGAVSRRIHRG